MRVYQGTLKRGDFVTFGAQRSKLKVALVTNRFVPSE